MATVAQDKKSATRKSKTTPTSGPSEAASHATLTHPNLLQLRARSHALVPKILDLVENHRDDEKMRGRDGEVLTTILLVPLVGFYMDEIVADIERKGHTAVFAEPLSTNDVTAAVNNMTLAVVGILAHAEPADAVLAFLGEARQISDQLRAWGNKLRGEGAS